VCAPNARLLQLFFRGLLSVYSPSAL